MNRRNFLGYAGAMLALAAVPRGALAETDLGSPRRTGQIKATLVIKDSQKAPWSDYVQALADYRAAERDVREAEIELMGGAQALDDDNDAVLRERQGTRLLAKEALRAKYDALYELLDARQKQIADVTLTAGECGR